MRRGGMRCCGMRRGGWGHGDLVRSGLTVRAPDWQMRGQGFKITYCLFETCVFHENTKRLSTW